MNSASPNRSARQYREASQWLLRLNGATPEESDIAGWLHWCEENPENLKAFERIQQDWREIVSLRQDAAFALNHGHQVGIREPAKAPKSRWRHAVIPAAAAVLALAVFSSGRLIEWRESWKGEAIVAKTANRVAPLADGSTLILRAKAVVRVDFSPTERRLKLEDGGEAFFKVAPDPQRPFIVNAGELAIQAVGTSFNVRHQADTQRIWVTVEEGRVKISGPGQTQWMAAAGDRLEYAPGQSATLVAHVNVKAATGWRDGEFAYDKVPLFEVIEDIARYSNRPIVIGDEQARQIPYTGTVFVRSLDDWLAALSMKYPLKVIAEPDGKIVLASN